MASISDREFSEPSSLHSLSRKYKWEIYESRTGSLAVAGRQSSTKTKTILQRRRGIYDRSVKQKDDRLEQIWIIRVEIDYPECC